MSRPRVGIGVLLAACLAWACTNVSKPPKPPPTPKPEVQPGQDGGTDSGTPDAGPDAGTPDAGQPDAGTPDAGQPDAGTPDAGTPDGGTDAGVVGYDFPNVPGWQFWGVQNGGPAHVDDVTMDEGGNLWVAGDTDGLFLLTPAEQAKGANAKFRRFTMDDGLHPWGYMQDGSDAPGPHYLQVISVSGGPAGTVFVGYRGKPLPGIDEACESNWDDPPTGTPDPSVYKSGDADRVELQPDGTLKVVHYDIFSGPGSVSHEQGGREKVCSIYRIVYDKGTSKVWFGGNHGFAVGDPNFRGPHATNCFGNNYGDDGCKGLFEHAHPGLACYPNGASSSTLCTYRYLGIGAVPGSTMVWIGGWDRSVHFDFGPRWNSPDFWTYEGNQFDPSTWLDVWPDAVPNYVHSWEAKQDQVVGVAAMPDGSAWFASAQWGLAHYAADGSEGFVDGGGLPDRHLSAIARDTRDNASIWIGGWGWVSHMSGGQFTTWGPAELGPDLTAGPVSDIQSFGSGKDRKVLVGFRGGDVAPDAVGVYSGN